VKLSTSASSQWFKHLLNTGRSVAIFTSSLELYSLLFFLVLPSDDDDIVVVVVVVDDDV
jgi:hypothetical protein